jgi:protein-tyrosine-phosphatase
MTVNTNPHPEAPRVTLFPRLEKTVAALETSMDEIPEERKALLSEVAASIADHERRGEPSRMVFICTHNSRRSHMSQIWAQAAAWLSGIRSFEAYSGGTEATAFHPNAIRALRDCGFRIDGAADMQNPHYTVAFADEAPTMEAWSKRFDDARNPRKDFAAVMTCSDADEACPFVPGAKARFPVRYEDPKHSDGTQEEADVYAASCREIGHEMLYVARQAALLSRSA